MVLSMLAHCHPSARALLLPRGGSGSISDRITEPWRHVMQGKIAVLLAGMLVASSGIALHAQQQRQSTPPPTRQQRTDSTSGVMPRHMGMSGHPMAQHMGAAGQQMGSQQMGRMGSQPMGAHRMWTADQIKEAQMALAHLKLYMGKQDGVLGRETRHAIRQFERMRDLPVTGQLSDSVLVLLRSTNNPQH
jgi:hypothetical protein